MRNYIKINDDYFELEDIIQKYQDQYENVYFYKEIDDNFELVYKEFDVAKMKIYTEDKVPKDKLPRYHEIKIEYSIMDKIKKFFKGI